MLISITGCTARICDSEAMDSVSALQKLEGQTETPGLRQAPKTSTLVSLVWVFILFIKCLVMYMMPRIDKQNTLVGDLGHQLVTLRALL